MTQTLGLPCVTDLILLDLLHPIFSLIINNLQKKLVIERGRICCQLGPLRSSRTILIGRTKTKVDLANLKKRS